MVYRQDRAGRAQGNDAGTHAEHKATDGGIEFEGSIRVFQGEGGEREMSKPWTWGR